MVEEDLLDIESIEYDFAGSDSKATTTTTTTTTTKTTAKIKILYKCTVYSSGF